MVANWSLGLCDLGLASLWFFFNIVFVIPGIDQTSFHTASLKPYNINLCLSLYGNALQW